MGNINTVEQLKAIYGEPHERSVTKEISYLHEPYKAFVKASPFIVIATSGANGIDCSPKGDAPGFVRMIHDKTIAIPDRPGNNRIDNLLNIIGDPRISVLFLVPGIGETLRVNGRAEISNDAALLESFAVSGKPPRTVLLVHVEAAYFHCARALVRSKLWDPSLHRAKESMPSAGDMIAAISEGFDGKAYDRELPERVKKSLY